MKTTLAEVRPVPESEPAKGFQLLVQWPATRRQLVNQSCWVNPLAHHQPLVGAKTQQAVKPTCRTEADSNGTVRYAKELKVPLFHEFSLQSAFGLLGWPFQQMTGLEI